MYLAVISSLVVVATATFVPLPSFTPFANNAPTVVIKNGTIVGSRTTDNLEIFRGIPFVQPPVGNLRLRPPQPITKTFGTFQATATPKSCPQFPFTVNSGSPLSDALVRSIYNPTGPIGSGIGEDCLTLDVYRPANLPANAKIPVVFYIFGGGFAIGTTPVFDGSTMVKKSVEVGSPIIYVVGSHRLAGFGFLPGKEVSADGASNLGLKDQRVTMHWIQENIAAFGGDPDRVTIWGPSSGAVSVFTHLLINGGDHTYNGKPLFRAAIMNSGTSIPVTTIVESKAQAVYDQVATAAGCIDMPDSLACLRSLDYAKYQDAAASVPSTLGYRPLDLSYTPRPDESDNFYNQSPELSLQQGKYARVPIIVSDVEDEGTYFACQVGNLTTVDQLIDYYTSYFPKNASTRDVVKSLVDTYSAKPADGAPYYTGDNNQLYPQYKRLAAVIGDSAFLLQRRYYLSIVSSQIKAWSYYASNNRNTGVLGTFHGTDGYPPLNVFGLAGTHVGQTLLGYYVSFINTMDPNGLGISGPLIPWPTYSVAKPQMLQIMQFSNNLMLDTFRNNSYNFLVENMSKLRF